MAKIEMINHYELDNRVRQLLASIAKRKHFNPALDAAIKEVERKIIEAWWLGFESGLRQPAPNQRKKADIEVSLAQ